MRRAQRTKTKGGTIDWAAIAAQLVERFDRPLTLLDREARILLFNPPMERLMGSKARDVVSKPWREVFESNGNLIEAVETALRGARRACEVEAKGTEGRSMRVRLELWPVGAGQS